jgi:hypothetical protein
VRTSLVLSVLLHIVVLSAVLFNFSTSTTLDANHQPVAVELISPSDITQVKAGKKDAPKEEAAAQAAPPPAEKKPEQPAPAAPEPKPVDKQAEKQAVPPPPPPKQEAAKAEPPKPEPAKPEPAKPEPVKAEPEPKPEPEKKVAAAKPEPKREEGVKPEPKKAEPKPKKPEPKPEPKEAKAEPKPEQEKTPFRDRIADLLKHPAEEQKPQQQPAPPAQTKREFDADRIQALLNRDPRAGAPATQEGPKEPWRKPSSLEEQAAGLSQPAPAQPRETHGAPSGQDARMSASDIDYFRSQISRCWTPPVGGLGAEDIVVKLRIELNKDGTLVRPPQIANGGSTPFFTAAADSAMRAVFQCQPYAMPADKYSQWRDMLLNFDPRRMYGG